MAIKLPNFNLFKGAGAKTRLFFIFGAVAAIAFTIFLIVNYFNSGSNGTGATKLAGAPSNLQTVPGSKDQSPEFYRAVVQANKQASQQAQITGGSAVPILMNIPGQSNGFAQQSCAAVCPDDDKVNVADDINKLVKDGKLSQEDANKLLDLAKADVSVDEYGAALNDLVRQGKLTPEQARDLLDKYKKQHANVALAASGQLMDEMIRSGALPIETANRLLALQKSGISPADYAQELNRLVREGKISPETAARLLAQYTQQKMQEQGKKGAFALQQMAKNGEITPDVARSLAELQNKNVTAAQYAAELDRLVAAGKMTPAAANKLKELYTQQKAAIGSAGTLKQIVAEAEANSIGCISDLVKANQLSQDDGNNLIALQQNKVSAEEFQAALSKLITDKKITSDNAKKLAGCYGQAVAARAQAERLMAMQANNAGIGDYTNELKKAVQAGLISPEAAATLLEQYRAATTQVSSVTPLTTSGGGAALPGVAEFAQLQQRLNQAPTPTSPEAAAAEAAGGTGTGATAAQFQTAEAQAQAATEADLEADRQKRIEQIQGAMAAQAQQLLAAWQPPIMVHKEGSPPEKAKEGSQATGASATSTTEGGKLGSSAASKRALLKAGTILFAILDTAVDSDYPDTPVLATIIMGELKGAKLLGKLSLVQDKDRVSLNFNLMDKEGWPAAKSVSAFAIDPDTARTVMASNVDYHYFKRYGAMMATSFLTGYSNAITQAGTATTGIFGTSTTHPALSPGNKIAVGLGQIGTTMGAAMASYINTPTTVKVNAGVGLGILFMAEVKE